MSSTYSVPLRARRILVVVLALLLLASVAGPSVAAPPSHAQDERTVTVMARNLYLGATLTPLFPDPPLAGEAEVLAAATELWHQVLATDFPVRADALADEVAAHEPDLLGLQEATLYRVGFPGDPAPATEIRLDFLEILQAELLDRGLRYDVVVSQEAFDGELTAVDWPGLSTNTGGLTDVRLTDRDVILVRRAPETANLNLSNAQSGLFAQALPLEVLGEPLPIVRGWTSVDVKLRGRSFRFINTHLEAFNQTIAFLQAQELLTTGPAATTLPVVLLGDFNSAPGEAAYQIVTGAGFTDVAIGGAPTCCYDADLADPTAELDSRIDLVFTRGPIEPRSVVRVGTEPVAAEQPLWASDHAGLVAALVLDATPPTSARLGKS